jgi:hypothetical protein
MWILQIEVNDGLPMSERELEPRAIAPEPWPDGHLQWPSRGRVGSGRSDADADQSDNASDEEYAGTGDNRANSRLDLAIVVRAGATPNDRAADGRDRASN